MWYLKHLCFHEIPNFLGNVLKPYFKEDYIPGIGLLATLALITILGWMSTKFLTGTFIRLLDRLLESIPIVKTI